MPDESLDYSAVTAGWQAEATNRAAQRMEQVRIARVVALRMDELTLSDEWNVYAAHVKGWLETVQREYDATAKRLLESEDEDLTSDKLLTLRFRLRHLKGQLEAWEAALGLPQHLQELARWTSPSGSPSPSPSGS